MPIAIDSNVIPYAFDSDALSKQNVARAILRNGRHAGLVIPLQVLGEVYAVLTVRRKCNAGDAGAVVTSLMSTMSVCLSSKTSLQRAMTLSGAHTVSFWDAQIVAVAAEHGCNTLLSEDFQDGRRFAATDVGRTLRVLNPFQERNFEMLEMLELFP